MSKFARKIGIDLTISFRMHDFHVRFLIFEIWSILYVSLCNAFMQDLTKIWREKNGGGLAPLLPPPGLRLCTPHILGLRTLVGTGQRYRHISQSLPRYAKSRSLLTTVKYKIDHNSKTKNHTEKTHGYKNSGQYIGHLLRLTSFLTIFGR